MNYDAARMLANCMCAVALTIGAVSYKRTMARDEVGPLRYEHMWAAGVQIDYPSEPVSNWQFVSGAEQVELTGGGQTLVCVDSHIQFGEKFPTKLQPATIGEAIYHCRLLKEAQDEQQIKRDPIREQPSSQG